MGAHIRQRLRGAEGFTLVETVVVLAILGIVLLGLTTSMLSGTNSEVVVAQRQQAEANARSALERMRLDIHCASSVGGNGPQQNTLGGFTLTLNETAGQCPSSLPVGSGASGVQWCTIPVAGSTVRYQLYREYKQGSGDCDGVGSTFVVDYVTEPPAGWPTNTASPTPTAWDGNLWPTATTCSTGSLPTVTLDLAVNSDPVGSPNATYELKDRIALRNAPPC